MSLSTFAVRRAHTRKGLLAVIAVMTMLITLILAGTMVYLDVGSTAAVHQSLDERPADERTTVIQTRFDQSQPGAQDQTVRQILTGSVSPDPQIWHSLITAPRAMVGHEVPDVEEPALILRHEGDLPPAAGHNSAEQHTGTEHTETADDTADDDAHDGDPLTLVSGTWPSATGEGALHAGAAAALELSDGDEVTVVSGGSEHSIRVTALWEPTEPDHSRWGGEEIVRAGVDPLEPEVFGPLLVDLSLMLDLADTPLARWTVAAPADLGAEDIPRWTHASAGWLPAVRDSDVPIRGLTSQEGLQETLPEINETLSAVRAASLAPLVIVGLLSVVAAWQLAHLLAVLRRRETLVLVSRGASRAQVNRMVIIEAVVLAVPGAAIAAGVLWAVATRQPGFNPALLLAAAGGVAAVIALGLIAVGTHATRTALTAEDASGRSGTVLTSGALLLTVAAAAFTLWRLHLAGGPLVPGTDEPDLLAVAGPGLGLLAAALLAIALAAPLSRIVAALSARRRGFSPAIEARQISRQISLNAVPVMLLVLATATTTLAAAYAGTWTQLRSTSAQVSNGADLRVPFGNVITGSNTRDLIDYGALDGVDADSAVLHSSVRLDSQEGQLTALPASGWAVSSAPEDVLGPITSASLAASDALTGPELPDDAGTLQVQIQAAALTEGMQDDPRREVTVRTWLWNGHELLTHTAGSLQPVAGQDFEVIWGAAGEDPEFIWFEPDGRGEPVQADLEVELPEGQWTLVALDLDLESQMDVIEYDIQVTSLTAGGHDLLPRTSGWAPVQLEPRNVADNVTLTDAMAVQAEVSLHPEMTGGSAMIRMLPADSAGGSVPVLSTPPWAEEVLETGTTVQVGSVHLPVASVGTVPVVPGNPDTHALVADLPTLLDALLRNGRTTPATNEVWLATEDAESVAAAAQEQAGPRVEVQVATDGSPDSLSLPALVVFWAAALCAVALALPGVIAVAMAHLSRRRGEVVVLRAVGAGSAQQGRSRRREILGISGWAVLAGIGAGVGLAALVIVDLVRSTTPGVSAAVPVSVTYDLTGGAIGVGVLAGAVLLTAWWYGRRVRAQVLDATWREEIR